MRVVREGTLSSSWFTHLISSFVDKYTLPALFYAELRTVVLRNNSHVIITNVIPRSATPEKLLQQMIPAPYPGNISPATYPSTLCQVLTLVGSGRGSPGQLDGAGHVHRSSTGAGYAPRYLGGGQCSCSHRYTCSPTLEMRMFDKYSVSSPQINCLT